MTPAFATREFSNMLKLPRSINPWAMRRKHYVSRFEHWKTTYEGRVCNALGAWSRKNGREALAR